jgi:hypothetical protein
MNMTSVMTRTLVRLTLTAIALLTVISVAHAQAAKPTVYKIADAGVQIDLPTGWEAGKDPNGSHTIMKKDGDGYVLFSLSVLPRDPSVTIDALFGAFSEGIFEQARKDWKGFKPGTVLKDTTDGMALRAQKFDGSMESSGGELEGLVVVIDSLKPLAIFGQRTKKHSDALQKEASDILGSIKKIQ